jgi:hypothetical protein
MSEPTFVCKDCGAAVFDALGQVRERCYPCQWVANIPDVTERAEIRAWLIEAGAIDPPDPHGSEPPTPPQPRSPALGSRH